MLKLNKNNQINYPEYAEIYIDQLALTGSAHFHWSSNGYNLLCKLNDLISKCNNKININRSIRHSQTDYKLRLAG